MTHGDDRSVPAAPAGYWQVTSGDTGRVRGVRGGLTGERLQPRQAQPVREDEQLHGVQVGRGGEDPRVEEIEDGTEAGAVGAWQEHLWDGGIWGMLRDTPKGKGGTS